MEKIQKIIVILLVIAIIFSISATFINFSLINFKFEPVKSERIEGDSQGNINLYIEGNPNEGG